MGSMGPRSDARQHEKIHLAAKVYARLQLQIPLVIAAHLEPVCNNSEMRNQLKPCKLFANAVSRPFRKRKH
jgi:hypothetical protein